MNTNLKITLACLVIVLGLAPCTMEQVNEGNRGIETRFGKVIGKPLDAGLHFYNPVTSNIFEIDVRERKLEAATDCFTRDTQKATVTYSVTFYPDKNKIHDIYSQFGSDWETRVLNQAILGSIKDVIGQYIADDLVGKREQAKAAAEAELKSALASRDVILTRLDFTNLDFDDAYEKAVEQKVVAIQKAAEAKNKTVEVEEQAKQTVMAANADAEAMRIKSQALSQNKGLVEYEIAKRWNGVLPQYMMGNSVPMISLDKLKSN